MNKKQRILISTVAAFLVISGLFPPWEYELKTLHTTRPAGYGAVFSPPAVTGEGYARVEIAFFGKADMLNEPDPQYFQVSIDKDRLTLEWFVIGAVGLLLFLVFQERKVCSS
jgi:hypothetical protein